LLAGDVRDGSAFTVDYDASRDRLAFSAKGGETA
jgi:hypothetical protein